MEGPSQSSQAQLCRNGCGFYGSSKNDGMCSLCYKDTLQKKNNSGRKSPAAAHLKDIGTKPAEGSVQTDGTVANAMASLATTDNTSASQSSPSIPLNTTQPMAIPSATNPATALTSPSLQNSSFDEASTSIDSNSSPSKPKKNRCASCRKRLGLTGFYCRCGKIFCSLHRYSDQHSCDFDYKADAQAKIRKENPVVVGEKINKI